MLPRAELGGDYHQYVGRRLRKNSLKISTALLLYGVVGAQVGQITNHNYMIVSS